MVWGEPGALSLIDTIPVLVPVAVGENVTLMWQEALGARLAGGIRQSLVSPKSPVMVMLEKVKVSVPVFVTVTV